MWIKKFVVVICFFASPVAWSSPINAHRLELIGLQFKNSVLEGEVVNKGSETAKEVWVHVSFKDYTGLTVFEQDFRVIPGGDGKPIPKGWSKHFKYQLKLSSSTELTPVGFIKSVEIN